MIAINFQAVLQNAENILFSALIFILVVFEIWLINRGSAYLKRKTKNLRFRIFKIQSFELLGATKQRLALIGIITGIKIILILLVIYFSLIIILGIFPGTDNIVNNLVSFIFDPIKTAFQGFIEYLPKLFSIVIIIIIFHYLKKLVKGISVEIQKGRLKIAGFEPYWARTTGSIVVFILNILALILILPYLPGYESLAFKGVAAFVGVLVTIGGSSMIANFMAGIVISYMNPLQIGDLIKIEDTTGEVIEISRFSIKVQTPKMVLVSIPNTKILSSHIINYNGGKEKGRTLLHTEVSIGYDVPLEKVNELLISAAEATERVDAKPPPFVRQTKLDDFYVVYELNAYTSDIPGMFNTYSEMHKNILTRFNKEGIEILSPHYQANRDGSDTTIPEEK